MASPGRPKSQYNPSRLPNRLPNTVLSRIAMRALLCAALCCLAAAQNAAISRDTTPPECRWIPLDNVGKFVLRRGSCFREDS